MTTPGPGTPPGSPQPGWTPPPPPPPKAGMSTGAKVLIGCGITAVALIVLLVAVFGTGAWLLNREMGDAGFGRQAQVTNALEELDRDVDFTPPADGEIGSDRATRFFAVLDAAWAEVGSDLSALADLDTAGDRRPTMSEARSGLRGLSRGRIAVGEAMQAQQVAPSEFLWTGYALQHAWAHRDEPPEQSGVPAANIELARQHASRMAGSRETEEGDRITPWVLFGVAESLVLSQDAQRRLRQFDTLRRTSR